jgi:hypothetical protein
MKYQVNTNTGQWPVILPLPLPLPGIMACGGDGEYSQFTAYPVLHN